MSETMRAVIVREHGGLDHLLRAPVQAAEQNFDLPAFFAFERPRRIGAVGLAG